MVVEFEFLSIIDKQAMHYCERDREKERLNLTHGGAAIVNRYSSVEFWNLSVCIDKMYHLLIIIYGALALVRKMTTHSYCFGVIGII